MVSTSCHVVLVGDPNQLPSVGAGNILYDLMALVFPYYCLCGNLRKSLNANALQYNVTNFSRLSSAAHLAFDSSFQLFNSPDAFVQNQIADTAATLYRSSASAQVIVPFRHKSSPSAWELNQAIQQRVNPPCVGKPRLTYNETTFQDGYRVLITKNSPDESICNGDIGTLSISCPYDGAPTQYSVRLKDGRHMSTTTSIDLFSSLSLAYAITIYKAQGSKYDTVIIPVTSGSGFMMTRNLFYTAISRVQNRFYSLEIWEPLQSVCAIFHLCVNPHW